ncbi:MAG: hypothetical protein AB8H80_12605 [Planctomycetota bacterium]
MSKEDDARRRRLRAMLNGDEVDLAVGAEDLRWLLDEVGRLAQSNDRLRRQNRRLRLKARGESPAGGDGADAGPDDSSDVGAPE